MKRQTYSHLYRKLRESKTGDTILVPLVELEQGCSTDQGLSTNPPCLKDKQWYRVQLEALYQRYCPDDAAVKISKLDGLLEKYRGNEEELLLAVQQKYGTEGATRVVSLEHFDEAPSGRPTDAYEMLGLSPVQDALDRCAKELGGELRFRRWPAKGSGRLELAVCVPAVLKTPGDTEAAQTLGKMKGLIRIRHQVSRGKSTGLLLQVSDGEHERRQIEKERSQRKNGRQKNKGHRNNRAGLQR